MLIFAIETSCDETSVCILKNNKKILAHIVYSQKIHEEFGGVIPELASRSHLQVLQKISKDALQDGGVRIEEIDIFLCNLWTRANWWSFSRIYFCKRISNRTKKTFCTN